MSDESPNAKQKRVDSSITRRTFLGMSLGTAATLFAGGSATILGADSSTATSRVTNPTWQVRGDLPVSRLGSCAARIPWQGLRAWPPARSPALSVPKLAA